MTTKQNYVTGEKFDKRLDEVMNTLTDFIGELQNFREEMTVLPYQVTEVRGISEDHEKRITKLEQVVKLT